MFLKLTAEDDGLVVLFAISAIAYIRDRPGSTACSVYGTNGHPVAVKETRDQILDQLAASGQPGPDAVTAAIAEGQRAQEARKLKLSNSGKSARKK